MPGNRSTYSARDEESQYQKHTLNLYRGDYDRLKVMFPEIGAAVAIRKLVRNYLEATDSKLGEVELGVKVKI